MNLLFEYRGKTKLGNGELRNLAIELEKMREDANAYFAKLINPGKYSGLFSKLIANTYLPIAINILVIPLEENKQASFRFY